tara:strand:- start:302 stop:586 length:285 start_codon:yes stop_codon:yes gene_type:complete
MAQTLPDITIGQTWVDINTESGIDVGEVMLISNKGSGSVLLLEQTTTPSDSSNIGVPMTSAQDPYAVYTILSGSLKVWCKAKGVLGTTLNVQAV